MITIVTDLYLLCAGRGLGLLFFWIISCNLLDNLMKYVLLLSLFFQIWRQKEGKLSDLPTGTRQSWVGTQASDP